MSHAPAGQICKCDERGWMPGIEHVPVQWGWESLAWIKDRDGLMAPQLVVDHILQGWGNTMVLWAQNVPNTGLRKVYYHFVCFRTGRVIQFQSVFTPAIHASALIGATNPIALAVGSLFGVNTYSVGKGHEGFSVDLKDSSGRVLQRAYSRTNPWPEPMVASSLRVDRWLFSTVESLGQPSRARLAGHYEFDARNRPNDPAPAAYRSIWPVEAKLAALAERVGAPAARRTYTVQPGDYLSKIALRFAIPTASLQAWNNITNPNLIQVGQVLFVEPLTLAPPAEPPMTTPPPVTNATMGAAWQEFSRNGAVPHDVVFEGEVRMGRYLVKRRV